jgi:hypothetical protein
MIVSRLCHRDAESFDSATEGERSSRRSFVHLLAMKRPRHVDL